MKILTVLTYYRPHTSGLTIYAERLARAFARRGHQVTVMTTQYDPSLLLEETLDEEKAADEKLTEVAESVANPQSA